MRATAIRAVQAPTIDGLDTDPVWGNAVAFSDFYEFTPNEGRFPDYMAVVDTLREDLAKADGFIGLERFESITTKGRFLSLQFWRDDESVRKWRNLQKHREAQKKGRGSIFKSYRLRIAEVRRDYTMDERAQAPADSVQVHG